jgi:hypothetical protein
MDLRELVTKDMRRPERPEAEDVVDGGAVMLISDDHWSLIEDCWHHEPKHRPSASVVCERLSQILEIRSMRDQVSSMLTPPPQKVRPRPEAETVRWTPATSRPPPHPSSTSLAPNPQQQLPLTSRMVHPVYASANTTGGEMLARPLQPLAPQSVTAHPPQQQSQPPTPSSAQPQPPPLPARAQPRPLPTRPGQASSLPTHAQPASILSPSLHTSLSSPPPTLSLPSMSGFSSFPSRSHHPSIISESPPPQYTPLPDFQKSPPAPLSQQSSIPDDLTSLTSTPLTISLPHYDQPARPPDPIANPSSQLSDPWDFSPDLEAILLLESGREKDAEDLLHCLVNFRERAFRRKAPLAALFALDTLRRLYYKQWRLAEAGRLTGLIQIERGAETEDELFRIEVRTLDLID